MYDQSVLASSRECGNVFPPAGRVISFVRGKPEESMEGTMQQMRHLPLADYNRISVGCKSTLSEGSPQIALLRSQKASTSSRIIQKKETHGPQEALNMIREAPIGGAYHLPSPHSMPSYSSVPKPFLFRCPALTTEDAFAIVNAAAKYERIVLRTARPSPWH